jgi:hypothetical protein
VDEILFYVFHVLLVLVQIKCTYIWYTYYEYGYLVCQGYTYWLKENVDALGDPGIIVSILHCKTGI